MSSKIEIGSEVRGEKGIRAACRQLVADLDGHFAGMADEALVLVLGAIAGQHVLLLGPPGVAKTEITTRLSAGIGGRYFYRNLDEGAMPTSVLGPYDMREATTTGDEVHRTEGFLPSAHIAMLDEVFKSNSMVLNSLLPALSPQRVIVNNGKVENIPLVLCVGASNEYPRKGNEAFFDRFPLRCWVEGIKGPGEFAKLWSVDGSAPQETRVTVEELEVARNASRALPLGDGGSLLARAVEQMCSDLARDGIRVSPRKVKLAQRLLQAFAWYSGDESVEIEHTEVLRHLLWDHHDQRQAIEKVVAKHSTEPAVSDIEKVFRVTMQLLTNAPKEPPAKFDKVWLDKWSPVAAELKNARLKIESLATKSPRAEKRGAECVKTLNEAAAPLHSAIKLSMGFA